MGHPSTWSDRLAARWPDTERRRSLAAGLGFGASGALVALVLAVGYFVLEYSGYYSLYYWMLVVLGLPLAAGLGAAVAGAPLWWVIVERTAEPTARRGGLVGAVVGVVAHPLMWLLSGVGMGVLFLIFGGIGALADALGDLGFLLGRFVLFSVGGVLITGIVTVPVAAKTGVALARVRRKASGTARDAPRRPDDL